MKWQAAASSDGGGIPAWPVSRSCWSTLRACSLLVYGTSMSVPPYVARSPRCCYGWRVRDRFASCRYVPRIGFKRCTTSSKIVILDNDATHTFKRLVELNALSWETVGNRLYRMRALSPGPQRSPCLCACLRMARCPS